MTSQINPSVPADGVPAIKEELRNNLLSAQIELNHGGFAAGLLPTHYAPPGSEQVRDHLAAIDAALGALDFAALADTPTSLAGAAAKFVRVKADESGLEFVASSGASNADAVDYTAPHAGAVTRSVRDRLAQILNVRDFGAAGDGSANDTAAIQAALNAAPNQGAAVFFPAGTYRVTSTLTIPEISSGAGSNGILGIVKPVVLMGPYQGGWFGGLGSNTEGSAVLKLDTGAAIALLDASGPSGKAHWYGGIRDLALQDVQQSANTIGLKLAALKGARFERLAAHRFWKNVAMVDTDQAEDLGAWYSTWVECVLIKARSINLDLQGSAHGASFVRCRFSNSDGIGAKFGHDTSPFKRAGVPLTFFGCWCEGNKGAYGMEFHNAQVVSIFGGYFELNEGNADIYISGSESTANLNLFGTHHFWTSAAGGNANLVEVNSKSSSQMNLKLIGCNAAPSSGQPAAVEMIGGSPSKLSIISMHNGTHKAANTMDLYAGALGDVGGLMTVDCELARNQNPGRFLVSEAWTVV